MTMVSRRQRRRRKGRSSILSCAAAIAAVSSAPDAFAFAPPPLSHDVRGGGRQRRSFVPLPSRATTDPVSSSSAATAERPTTAVQEEDNESAPPPPPLSETDARVLRSILSDENLDFKTEDNLKKLLERGVKSKESPSSSAGGGVAEAQDGGAADGKKKYASKTVEKLSSEGFWNSLQAKAEALLDSARLYVTNRIERDAKVLGAVGLFAWDRAKRDVARALPSVATRAKKVVRTLGEKSSFEDLAAAAAAASREKEFGAGSEERKDGATEEEAVGATTESEGTTSVYEEFATPADELRSVSESIRDILSGSGDDVLSTTGTGSASGGTRGLRSVAPAGFANRSNRQQRAYRRRKETTLKREREGADKKIGRGVGQVADAAWEMKREMEVETNRAGYRTEGVRNAIEAGAAATAARLAAGKGEGWGRRLSTGAAGRTLFDVLDDAGAEVVEDVEPLEFEAASEGAAATTNRRVANEGIPTRRPAVVVAEAVVEYPTVVVASVPPPPTEIPTVAELLDERARLASSLRLCLDAPDETWLIPDVVAASAEGRTSSVDDEALADAIALMIRARDEWEHREEENFLVMDEEDVLEELARTKRTADEMAAAVTKAAGTGAARRFEEELYGRGGEGEEGRRSILFDLDARETGTASTAAATNGADPAATERFAADGRADGPVRTDVAAASVAIEEEEGAAAVVAPEVLDAVVVTSSSAVDAGAAEDDETLAYDPADYMIDAVVDGTDADAFVPSEADRRAAAAPTAEHATAAASAGPLAVEVLTTDEELEGTIFEAKAAASVSEEEMAREEEDAKKPDEEDNVLVKAMLRALDVVFFVAEKTLTVALPGVLNAGGTFATRFQQVQRDGLGSKGWRRLTNARSGAKRY